MSFFHSQNVIDPEFFFPAFYDETVCINRKMTAKIPITPIPRRRISPKSFAPGMLCIPGLLSNAAHDVKHGYGYDPGQQIWEIKLPVIFDIGDRKFCIHSFIHFVHRPSLTLSVYLKFLHKVLRCSCFHGITDGTLRRL